MISLFIWLIVTILLIIQILNVIFNINSLIIIIIPLITTLLD
jgi:hypothetical protein